MIHIRLSLILFFIASLIPAMAFANEQLVLSVDLVRHGDRTPTHQIPRSHLNWKEGLGALTANGMAQEKRLGEYLREKYINQYHLLNATYDPNTIYVRSTDTERTIKSANSLLLGLYPLDTRSSKNQEIFINVVPRNKDTLLITKPSRNIFSIVKLYVINHKYWHEKTITLQNKLQEWSSITGLPLNNLQQLNYLADNLYIRQIEHLPLPNKMKQSDAMEIILLGKNAMIDAFKLNEITYPMGKEFLKTILNYQKLVVLHKTSLRYVLFLGHDSSIMSVMNTLQVPLNEIPGYASRVNFSIIKSGGQYFIKISYNDKPVSIPNCKSDICSLTQLENLISKS